MSTYGLAHADLTLLLYYTLAPLACALGEYIRARSCGSHSPIVFYYLTPFAFALSASTDVLAHADLTLLLFNTLTPLACALGVYIRARLC